MLPCIIVPIWFSQCPKMSWWKFTYFISGYLPSPISLPVMCEIILELMHIFLKVITVTFRYCGFDILYGSMITFNIFHWPKMAWETRKRVFGSCGPVPVLFCIIKRTLRYIGKIFMASIIYRIATIKNNTDPNCCFTSKRIAMFNYANFPFWFQSRPIISRDVCFQGVVEHKAS